VNMARGPKTSTSSCYDRRVAGYAKAETPTV
jgi:hypothetical protein